MGKWVLSTAGVKHEFGRYFVYCVCGESLTLRVPLSTYLCVCGRLYRYNLLGQVEVNEVMQDMGDD